MLANTEALTQEETSGYKYAETIIHKVEDDQGNYILQERKNCWGTGSLQC